MLIAALVLSAVVLGPDTTRAMSVSPVYLDMASTGPGSRADIRIANRSARPLPIETVVTRITRNGHGNLTEERADADFLVLPMQTMIPPGGSQILKVQWLGDPVISESRAYRVSINQLPVAQPGGGKAVQIVMNMAVVVHVAPPEGDPALDLVDTGTVETTDGQTMPTVTVRNPSAVHARLPDATIRLTAGGWNKVLTPSTLQALIGIGAVMPGQTRTFRLPVRLPDQVPTIQATLDYRAPARR